MVTPPRFQRESLTGRVRGRPRRFLSGLTLQVEVLIEDIGGFERLHCPRPPTADPRAWHLAEEARIAGAWRAVKTYWRDAEWSDGFAAGLCPQLRAPQQAEILRPAATGASPNRIHHHSPLAGLDPGSFSPAPSEGGK